MGKISCHHNELTEGQAERLAFLIEECSEAIQAATKILRHGYQSSYPDGTTNAQQLEKELGCVRYAIVLLSAAEDLDFDRITAAADARATRGGKNWFHHQG